MVKALRSIAKFFTMSSEIKKAQAHNVLFECLIFALGLCIVILVIIGNYVVNIKQSQRKTINAVTKKYAQFLKEFEYLPQNIAESPYIVFVIDKITDDFIIERNNAQIDEHLLWEQYKTKLIYQMQKQRQGWTEYPFKKPWQFFNANKVIRFLTLDDLGWIIALEATQPSEWDLVQQILTPKSGVQIFSVFLFGFILISLQTMGFSHNLRKIILNSLEKSYLNYDNEMSVKGKNKQRRKQEKPGMDSIINNIVLDAEKKAQKDTFADRAVLPKESVESVESVGINPKGFLPDMIQKTAPSSIIPPSKENKINFLKKEDKETVVAPKENKINFFQGKDKKPPVDEPSEDLSIELKGIQSSILKKMIKDLREE